MRAALRLSRLEVRRRRRLRRHDERAGGIRLQAQVASPPIRPANWAASSGPIIGPAEDSAGAEIRLDAGAGANRHVTKVIEECNWLQALEGGIDTSHAPILHRLLTDSSTRGGIKPSNPFVRGKAPTSCRYHRLRLSVRRHPSAGRRHEVHIRTYHFIMPFHQIRPSRSESGWNSMPAISGCRSMTTTAWSTTGATAQTGR